MLVDRKDAGRRLGLVLRRDLGAQRDDVVVVGVPPGGIAVASEIARMLGAPLDMLAVRELRPVGGSGGVFGAIGESGVRVLDKTEIGALGLTEDDVRSAEFRERIELDRLADRLRCTRPLTPLSGTTAVVVDDGMASPSMVRAACAVARADGAIRVVLAIPRIRPAHRRSLSDAVDELVTLEQRDVETPDPLYQTPTATTDGELVTLLGSGAGRRRTFHEQDVEFEMGDLNLPGHLSLGDEMLGVVVLASDDGGRHSPRNVYVASRLRRVGLSTLLVDLSAGTEVRTRTRPSDVDLLGGRLAAVTSQLHLRREIGDARLGLFGSGTGADAALSAAARRGVGVDGVVSCGGRPDPTVLDLAAVHAPTLLIAAGEDREAILLTHRAADLMSCPNRLWEVPGAANFHSDPNVLAVVADLTCVWFGDHVLRGDHAGKTGRG